MTETKIKVEDLPTVYDAKSTEEKMYKLIYLCYYNT